MHSLGVIKLRASSVTQGASHLLCLWSALLSKSPHHSGWQHPQVARVGLLCLMGRRCHADCQNPGCYSWELCFTVGTL